MKPYFVYFCKRFLPDEFINEKYTLMTKQTQFLNQLMTAPSVSGYEDEASKVFLNYVEPFAYQTEVDVLNNTYAFVGNPEAQTTVMVEAHIDEIGFQVLHISKEGFLYIRKNGGVDLCCIPGSQVQVLANDGTVIPGVIGKKPIHLISADDRKKAPELDALWVDTGLSEQEVRQRISVGDPVCFAPNVMMLGEHKITSKGLDDKIGVYVVAEALRRLARKKLNVRVCGVASSQEEVGCRGAVVGSANLEPDYAISLDVTFATDVPDCSARKHGEVVLGKGVVITKHLDSNRKFAQMAEKVAEEHKILHQLSANNSATGGTNASKIQLSNKGVRSLLLSIPNRYMHTPAEVCDMRDIDAAVELIVELVSAL